MNKDQVVEQLGEAAAEAPAAKTPREKAEERLQQLQGEQAQVQTRLQQLRQAIGQLEQAFLVNAGAIQETERVLAWLNE